MLQLVFERKRSGWCLRCVDWGIAERCCKVIVALKAATLLASPLVELVLRERPLGEHAMNGVAVSAMREVKRQTRTPHVGKDR